MDYDDPLIKQHSTLNPYRYGGSMLFRRLLWDICLQSWGSRKKLAKLKNNNMGEKAVILCNGPSLNKVDFDLIGSTACFTFGLNKINLLFERTDFRPSCIVAINGFVIDQNKDYYNRTDIPLFINSVGMQNGWVRPRHNVVFLHTGGAAHGFAKDCSISINEGHTVTYVALQLAFHMGFKYVALVGADHTFATKGPANKTVQCGERDESHFDPNYFANMNWELPDLFESEVAYMRANNMFNAHDRKVFNCTDGGKLEIFKRMDLKDFLSSG